MPAHQCNEEHEGLRYNEGKPRLSLFPFESLIEIAEVLTYGEKKYFTWNWANGLHYSKTLDSCLRHIAAWQRGEDIDPESGLSHLAHAACNLVFLLYYEKYPILYKDKFDDRHVPGLPELESAINKEIEASKICGSCKGAIHEFQNVAIVGDEDQIKAFGGRYHHTGCFIKKSVEVEGGDFIGAENLNKCTGAVYLVWLLRSNGYREQLSGAFFNKERAAAYIVGCESAYEIQEIGVI